MKFDIITLDPRQSDIDKYGPLAFISKKARDALVDLAFGKSTKAVSALEARVAFELGKRSFKEELFIHLEQANGVKSLASNLMGLSTSTVYRKILKYGLVAEVDEFISGLKDGIKNSREAK